jgi:hypothetical protein
VWHIGGEIHIACGTYGEEIHIACATYGEKRETYSVWHIRGEERYI